MLQLRRGQEYCVGPRALREALVSRDEALRALYGRSFSSTERLFLSEAYNPARALFRTLLIRTAFDWLVSRPEAPEDFESFYSAARWQHCASYRKTIYLQPIDVAAEGLGQEVVFFLDELKSYLEAFFPGLSVRFLPSISSTDIRCHVRQHPDPGNRQLHTDGILRHLKRLKPQDALCVVGLTFHDLYPCDSWNYTFGKSASEMAVGVCSFSRFSGGSVEEPSVGEADRSAGGKEERGRLLDFSLSDLLQCCKVLSHEVCHLVGLQHCRWLRCAMQGVTSRDELYLRPADLCPVCLRKLHLALPFCLVERYRRLQAWCRSVCLSWGPQGGSGRVTSEDPLLFSSDSGVSCENLSLSAALEPSSLETDSREASLALDGEEEGRPPTAASASTSASASASAWPCPPQEEVRVPSQSLATPLQDYASWLDSCIATLQRGGDPEDELSRLDGLVDALPPPRAPLDRAPALRVSLEPPRQDRRLRTVIGHKISFLRRKLSSMKMKSDHLCDDSED
ncbi:archaemetzincin-1 [Amia ocellicauda]|uniref:archaemetzincin-1 n=1 Tax=Amia ocellicauda TaxID=2972642 RepID=UPI003463C76B